MTSVIVLLLYFSISAAILLFGAEINAEAYRAAEEEGVVNEGRGVTFPGDRGSGRGPASESATHNRWRPFLVRPHISSSRARRPRRV